MTTRRARGITLHVDVRKGEGTPLLLCNGIGANLELLQPFVDALAARRGRRIPVIRFDMPGTGGSPTTKLPRRMPQLARMLADPTLQLPQRIAGRALRPELRAELGLPTRALEFIMNPKLDDTGLTIVGPNCMGIGCGSSNFCSTSRTAAHCSL